MAIQPDIVELLDEQQHDRRQLLLYAEQVDAMSSEAQLQVETIERHAEAIERLAERVHVLSSEAQRQVETIEHHAEAIERLTERVARGDAEREHLLAAHAMELEDLCTQRERDAAALAELRAWREAMERSRTYRLMRRLDGLYRLPLLGPALRALRQSLSRGLS